MSAPQVSIFSKIYYFYFSIFKEENKKFVIFDLKNARKSVELKNIYTLQRLSAHQAPLIFSY